MTDTIQQPPLPEPPRVPPRAATLTSARSPDAAEPSRRAVLAAGVAAGGALLLSACAETGTPGGSAPSSGSSPSPQPLNAALARLVELETTTIQAYAVNAPVVTGKAGAAARAFLEEHRAHLAALQELLAGAGGAPASSGTSSSSSSSAAGPPAPDAAAKALATAENAMLAGYVQAQTATSSVDLVAEVSGMMANEAQHIAAYAAIATPTANAVPAPFITPAAPPS